MMGADPAPGPEFFENEGSRQGPDDKSNNFRPHVLNDAGPVQAQCAGDIPNKTGHAYPHVAGIAPIL